MCWAAVRYLTGLSKEKPKIGRFGYAEKMEYWAVVWGTIIMGVTGLMIWFKMDVTHWLPRWVVDVALTIHYYEAILACLAIVVWHFYHVIFDPGRLSAEPGVLGRKGVGALAGGGTSAGRIVLRRIGNGSNRGSIRTSKPGKEQ